VTAQYSRGERVDDQVLVELNGLRSTDMVTMRHDKLTQPVEQDHDRALADVEDSSNSATTEGPPK
jgi:hypothetical protein